MPNTTLVSEKSFVRSKSRPSNFGVSLHSTSDWRTVGQEPTLGSTERRAARPIMLSI